ncbi:MAG: HzsA-related protein, partial [Planctomycetota bacterium]
MRTGAEAKYVVRHWEREFVELEKQIRKAGELYKRGRDPYEGMKILGGNSRILPSDRTPFDIEYRRTLALIDLLEEEYNLITLGRLRNRVLQIGKSIRERRAENSTVSPEQAIENYSRIAAIRREVALSNPLLNFEAILFAGRGNYYGDDPTGQHQLSGPLAFCNRVGGGLYIVKNYKTNAEIIDVLKDSVVEKGSYKGWKLSGKGSFYSPELSYDGKTILFSWSENRVGRERAGWGLGKVGPVHEWPPENVWHIFKVNVDGSGLTQLTEGPWNDFDAAFLPNGRIVFISERRGGYIRCFRKTLFMEPTNYVMHSMNADGSDITPISYFEASEWAPSVNNDGMLIYSRWDYIDRENGLGSKFWTCYPDGRNPRAPHGNYPHPYSVQPEYDGPKEGTRDRGACSEVHFRAIPNSPNYIFTGVPHHGASFGPLAMLDTRIRDEGTMNQITVITADQRFPESQTREGIETDDRILKYGTPWPLSEGFYICNYVQSLILLDRMGTKTIICSHEQCPNIGETMRLVEPIPVQPRPKPPVIPVSTYEGQRAEMPHAPAVISVMNINESDLPFPPDRPAKWMRIVQLFPKTTPHRDIPNTGYCNENIPRMSLGIVPAEDDGSVYCKAPVGKVLLFQALDENKMAIQSMRSATFVHKGEHLTCVGCHEDKWNAPLGAKRPKALQRPPSELIKEPGSQEPVTYYRTVKPIFEGKCQP